MQVLSASVVPMLLASGISASSEQVTHGGDDVEIGRIVCQAWRCVSPAPALPRPRLCRVILHLLVGSEIMQSVLYPLTLERK